MTMADNIMKKILLALALFVVLPFAAQAQWVLMKSDADKAVRAGIDYIYNLEFDSASTQFQYVINTYPEHPVGYFMDAMVDWWQMDTDYRYQTDELKKQFLGKISKVIDVSDKLLEKDPNDIVGLFFKGGAIGYRARYYLAIEQSWLKAASDGQDALEFLERSWKLAPGNKDVLFGVGLYHYFRAVIEEQYPAAKPLLAFYPAGDRHNGLLELKLAADDARFASYEAKTVLLQVYYQFEKNYQASMELSKELFERYPRNAKFHKYLANSYVRLGYSDLKEQTWREILLRVMNKQVGYDYKLAREAMYYIGDALLARGDYDQALKYFYKVDEFCRELDKGKDPSGWMLSANVRIGNIYDKQGKRDLAMKQYNKVLQMHDSETYHDQARKYIDKPYGT